MPSIFEEPLDLSDLVPPPPPPPEAVEPVAPVAIPEPPAAPQPAAPPVVAAAPPRAPGRFRLKIGPEQVTTEELVTPTKIKSWSSSLGFHVALLLLMALAILTPPQKKTRTIDTRLSAGDPFGSDLGQQLTGGQGMDEPLAMPYAPEEKPSEPLEALTLTEAPALEPKLTNPIARRDLERSAAGGGVALTGAGQAGSGDGFGVAKFGLGGKETINNVEVKVGNPQFTLIWNSTADLDLHVLEPGGSHIFWENRHGTQGGDLDVDDIDGFGPENVFWGGGLNKGNGPPGEYRWYVHYYGGLDGNLPTHWRVRLKFGGDYKVFEGRLNAIGQRSRIYSFKIEKGEGHGEGIAEPSDEAPRPERAGEGGEFDRSMAAGNRPRGRIGGGSGSFENPSSMLSGGLRRFGAEMSQEVDDSGEVAVPKGRTSAARARPAARQPSRAAEPPANRPAAPAPAAAEPTPTEEPAEAKAKAEPRTRIERDASGWLAIRPAGEGFRFQMPEEPAEERRVLEDRPGEPEIRSWTLNRGDGEFFVGIARLPMAATRESAGPLLDREARSVVAEAGGSEAVTSDTSKADSAERTLRFKVPDKIVSGGGATRIRLIVVGPRLIRLSVTGTEEFVAQPETARFLESYRREAD
jgi:hypothetical protein